VYELAVVLMYDKKESKVQLASVEAPSKPFLCFLFLALKLTKKLLLWRY